jgi:hypothetical protein
MILSLLFFSIFFLHLEDFSNILMELQQALYKAVFIITEPNSVMAYCEHKSARGGTDIAKTTGSTPSYINSPKKYMLA